MGKGSAPKTPDYTGAAQATAQGNLDAAKFTAGFNRVNTSGPYGSSTWQLRPGADPNSAKAGDYTLNSNIDPRLSGLVDSMMGSAGGDGKAAQDAYYDKATARYDERFGKDQSALESQLRNQGLVPGTEAWKTSMGDFLNNKSDAYAGATNDSILAGEQSQNSAMNRLIAAMQMAQSAVPGQTGATMGQVQGADLLGALQSKSAADQARYQTQSNNTNSLLSTGGTALAAFFL